MNKKQKRLISAAMLMAVSPLYAATVAETESNDTLQNAQYVMMSGDVTTIEGAIGTVGSPDKTTDVDFYSFYAHAGDVVTLDIDNGWGGLQRVDTIIAVYDSNGNLLRTNDQADPIDEGSVSRNDSRIDDFHVATSGVYTVGVSSFPRFFKPGGTVYNSNVTGGDYSLLISGVSPSTQQINIEVKPGSNEAAPINPKSKGKIPVALLSDANFDAMDIDTSTLTFGAGGDEASLSKCNSTGVDVNGDGLLDLVCHFENQAAGFSYESLEGVARGTTHGGTAFEGRAPLKVVPTLTR